MIKLEIPNDPKCLHAARTFFDILLGATDAMPKAGTPIGDAALEGQPGVAQAGTTTPPAEEPDANETTEWPQERNGVLFDSAGMPWDERIHVGTKTCKKDGTWKYGRGVQPLTIEEVEAELKAALAAPPAVDPAAGTATPPPPVVDPAAAAAAAQAGAAIPPPAIDPAAAAAAATPPPAATPITDFPSLMAVLSPKFQNGSLTMDYVNEKCVEIGLPQLAMASTRPDLIPTLAANLGV